jgi:hypothetical protein
MSKSTDLMKDTPSTSLAVLEQLSGTEGVTTALATVEPTISFGEPTGVHVTKTGLTFSRAVSIEDWTALGQKLKTMGGSIQWWIGDWLNYGEKTYGMKYFDAIATTGYDDGYLRNLSSVARNVDLSHRCDNLSWTHHREVAALEPEQQTHWLERAEKDSLSVRDLHQMLHLNPGAPQPTSIDYAVTFHAIRHKASKCFVQSKPFFSPNDGPRDHEPFFFSDAGPENSLSWAHRLLRHVGYGGCKGFPVQEQLVDIIKEINHSQENRKLLLKPTDFEVVKVQAAYTVTPVETAKERNV